MSTRHLRQLRALEGRRVSLALRDGSRLDGCQLISAGRSRVDTVWVFANGQDTFVRLGDVVDLWEAW
jgi:hypothetical protein